MSDQGRRGLVRWLAALLPISVGVVGAAEARRPNVVVFIADDLGYADLGFQGGRDVPTPHLDALAKGGVRCSSGYVSGPYCSPTRAGFLTGRYQQRFGHEFNPGDNGQGAGGAGGGGEGPRFGLPITETTLADRLKGAGYATGLVGKWHLGNAPRFHPQKRGFDEFFGFLGGAHTYFAGEADNIYRGTEVVKESTYLTDAFAREAVAFIDRHKAKPFFLELAFNAVHTPMDATDARLARFVSIADPVRRKYAAMLSAMDDAVGAVLAKIEAEGLGRDTLVVFFSDNGGPTMPTTSVNGAINAPLRGSKRTTLEGGIRVPFVFSWKGKLPEGTVFDKPIIQLDVLPTALAAAGVSLPKDAGLDGVDLLPHLTGQASTPPHEALYWRLGGQAAIRRGDWKLVRYDSTADSTAQGTDRAQLKAARKAAGASGLPLSPFRLYNLANDIGESRDLAHSHPDKVKELRTDWDDWSLTLARPLWGPGSLPVPPAR